MILWWARILIWVGILIGAIYGVGSSVIAHNAVAAVLCIIPFGIGLVGLMIAVDLEE